MLYNEFIKAGITLEEIELINCYAGLINLELGEHNGELCFVNSETEKVEFEGLNTMIKVIKVANNELLETINSEEDEEKLKSISEMISVIETKAKSIHKDAA